MAIAACLLHGGWFLTAGCCSINTALAKTSIAEPIVSNLVPPLNSVCHHNEVCDQVN